MTMGGWQSRPSWVYSVFLGLFFCTCTTFCITPEWIQTRPLPWKYWNKISCFECFCVWEMRTFRKRKAEQCHPTLPSPIHLFPAPLMQRKGRNRHRYVITTRIYIYSYEKKTPTSPNTEDNPQAPWLMTCPIYRTRHPTRMLQSIPSHPPMNAERAG